jgi:hypothetical protein
MSRLEKGECVVNQELEHLKTALREERRILAAICLDSPSGDTVIVSARSLQVVDENTAISKLAEPDGSITISVKPRA